jgi:tRNA threonylcarbamoyladenosine biosynthesis protein TsaB
LKGDFIAGEFFVSGQKNYSEKILSLIDVMLRSAETRLEDIDQVVVSTGPGSFTGLRVGISTAQGIAFALGVKLIGISSLEALAFQAGRSAGYVCPMIDARKKEVFTCLYSCQGDGVMEKVLNDTVVEPAKWLADIHDYKNVLFLGSGAYYYSNLIKEVFCNRGNILRVSDGMSRAGTLVVMLKELYMSDGKNELFNVVPAYVRPPDAVVGKCAIDVVKSVNN